MTSKHETVATFSIVAHDPNEQTWGIAVQSKFLAAGAVVPWARAGTGAIATQARANTSYGPEGLQLLEQGLSAKEVVLRLTNGDDKREERQLAVVDAEGRAAVFTGAECIDWAGHQVGKNYSCQGNILAGPEVVSAMATTFETASGDLADRLVAALRAGQEAGGDRRGRQSAALYVVKEEGGYGGWNDHYIDLRVDDHLQPIAELMRILNIFKLYFLPGTDEDLLELDQRRVREVQELLKTLGHYHAELTGDYDVATAAALERFHSIENFEERWHGDQQIDRRVLQFMRDKADS